MIRKFNVAAALSALFLSATAVHAAHPAVQCESGMLKAAAKYASCRLKADAKALTKGVAADYTKCDDKLGFAFQKAEAKFGLDCRSEGDLVQVQDSLTAEVQFVGEILSGASPRGRVTLTPQEICTVAINYHGVATSTINPDYCAIAEGPNGGRFDEGVCDTIMNFGGCTSVCAPFLDDCPEVSEGALIKASGF